MKKIHLAPIEDMDRNFLDAAFEHEETIKEQDAKFLSLRLNSVESA
eukprot:CAMPEP_0202979484 /NCGR_PEP_ID=MMETSP1396-20130829/85610_1 /ASSEMBLY_ACC=CAM_ASM_000872 /TAXON_ID= /ORGANISM="Pseudokeronopsis sp., Strain Brazil" /LENGTH=45 /DNA_ID= /DNA_START= /DNA_END= /DNA_ORIENTATION=